MAQEFVGGRLVNVEACSAPDGTVLGLSIWERIASTDGETLLAETIEHPVARKLVLELLEASPIPGPIDIDLIETPDGLHVLEVNTRFGGGYPTSHLAGAAFPEAMVSWMAGEAAPALERYRPGIRMMKQLRPVAFDDTRVAEAPRP
jgi:carbamoyl-phosphate synthase large subunit